MNLRSGLCVLAALVGFACSRGPIEPDDDRLRVDAETYARGLCSLKCYRVEECGLASQTAEECKAECVDEALETVAGDPCWAQWIEERRCHVEKSSCENVLDESPGPAAEAACERRSEQLSSCESL